MAGTGAATRRERARAEMRAAILDAARRLVSDDGVGALSMRAIARDLGYSPAALYEYFPAKEDVCRALFFDGAGGLAGMMERTLAEQPPDASPIAALAALGRGYRAYALANPDLFRLVFNLAGLGIEPGETTHGTSNGGYDLLVATARRGIEAGDFIAMPSEVLALQCWSWVHGFVMLELSGLLGADYPGERPDAEAVTFDTLFEATLNLLGHGILAR